MKYMLVLFTICSACGYDDMPKPDWEGPYHSRFFKYDHVFSESDQQQLSMITDLAFKRGTSLWDYKLKEMKDYMGQYLGVHISDKPIPCEQSSIGWCHGVTYWTQNIALYQESPCFASTAYSHELMHWIPMSFGFDSDSGHKDMARWNLSNDIDKEVRNELCKAPESGATNILP